MIPTFHCSASHLPAVFKMPMFYNAQPLSRVRLFVTPMICSLPGSSVRANSRTQAPITKTYENPFKTAIEAERIRQNEKAEELVST